MAKPRLFSTAAVAAMHDTDLTGQDWRVYLWVSLHDGMSLLKGKGAGCFTSNLKLAEAVQCDYSSLCRSLSKLVDRGHLVREKLGKATAYRVTFPTPDNLQARNISGAKSAPLACNDASDGSAITCNDFSETRRNLPKMEEHYSPLSGELYSVKTGKIDSAKQRDAHFDDFADDGFSDQASSQKDGVDWARQWDNPAGHSAPSDDWSQALTDAGKLAANLAQYERGLKSHPARYNLMAMAETLYRITEEVEDRQTASWAERLYELTWEKHAELQRRGKGGAIGNWVER